MLRGRSAGFAGIALHVARDAMVAGGAGLALPAAARAHAGRPPAPHDLTGAWSLEPAVVAGILAAAAIYALGVARLWRSAGTGRGIHGRRVAAYAGGILALVVALVSPLDAAAEALFSAHMVQHLALILVAAPLLVSGAPRLALAWAPPAAWRRRWSGGRAADAFARLGAAIAHPASAFALASAALWAWHLPGPYGAALGSDLVHALEHASFLGTGLLFWWVVIHPEGRRSLPEGATILYVLAMAAESSALGALLTFSPEAWYPAHAAWTGAWGMTPIEDQQVAGLVMWVPAGFVYLGTMAWLFLGWLSRSAAAGPRLPAGLESGSR